jgi:TonB-linked SusC/RagA family outer membrane protein
MSAKKKLTALLWGLLLLSVMVHAQTREVRGKITDLKDGLPLVGVTITVKGTNVSTATESDGTFKLTVPENATKLVVSSVGYKNQDVPISENITVSLSAGDNSLSEVVVVGYGTRLKKDVTASIAKVSSKEFQNLPLPSFEQALQGRAAGVFMNTGSGKLGQAMNIRVRGISSISANQQPFVVIDGVPVTSQALGSSTEPDNPLATINPDDIESIEVLKDAASSAIYGARASNGVILVTTKTGKQGKTRLNAGFFTGFSEPTRKGKFLNAAQYKELFTVAAENMGYDPAEEFGGETGTDDWNSNNDVNWADQAFRRGSISQYTVSLSGGDARTKFLFSGSYNDQKGIIIGDKLIRGTGRLNIDHTINAKFKVGANLSLNQTKNNRVPSDNSFSNPLQLNAIPPLHPLYDQDGQYNSATLYYNSLIEQEGNNENLSKTNRTISSAYAEWTINKSLRFRSQAGIDWVNLQENQFLGRRTLDGAPEGYSYDNQVTSSLFTTTQTLNYNKSFGENHDLEALAGFEYQNGRLSGANVTGRAFPSDRFTKIASAAIIEDGSSTETEYKFLSYFARANYKFKDRYLLGVSIRSDGSSRFGDDNKFGAFPAASAGWIISQEKFLENSNLLSFLKLRASYGITGNAEIGNYSSRSLFSASPYASIAGIIPSQIGVPDLSWENTRQFDIGIDFGLFDNRITGEIDYFNKDTRDLLLNAPIPSVNGYTSITKNIGSMTNKGFDFAVNALILTGEFKWNTSFNISTYKNEVTSLVAPVPPGQRTLGRLAVGSPFGEFYGIKYAGVDPENGDALYYMADGKTTTTDNGEAGDMVLGDPNPDYYGGWNNHFSYKGFDLDVQCQFVKGNDLYNIAGFFQSVNGDYFDNQTVDQMAYWKQAGDKTSIPQPRLYEGNGAAKSSRWIQDGSYFRLKSVNLGYNLPARWMKSAKINNARVFVAGQNLITITDYTGYDPEVNTTYVGNVNLGHDFYTPPQARTITFGLNIGL